MRVAHLAWFGVAACLSTPSHSQQLTSQYDGQDLLEFCSGTADNSQTKFTLVRMFCVGYVLGAADAFSVVEANHVKPSFCLTRRIPSKRIVASVVNYLKANPTALTRDASHAVRSALRISFPCR